MILQAYYSDTISAAGNYQVDIYPVVNGEAVYDDEEFESFKTEAAALARVEQINKARATSWPDLPERLA